MGAISVIERHLFNPGRTPKQKPFLFVCIGLLALLCSGCASDLKWKYTPAPPLNRSPLFGNTVMVSPFADSRPTEDIDHQGWIFIPIILYADSVYNRLDATFPESKVRFNPTEDLAKAVATELHNRRFFESVTFTPEDKGGELILRGEVTSTRLESRAYPYGLSIFGVYLWLVGLPAGAVSNQLGFTLTLEEPRTQTILWQKSYTVDHGETIWFYEAFAGKNLKAFFYEDMLKGLMPSILSDLENAMKTIASPSERQQGSVPALRQWPLSTGCECMTMSVGMARLLLAEHDV